MTALDLYKHEPFTIKDAEELYARALEEMGLDESETELDIYEQLKNHLDSRLYGEFAIL